VIALDENFKLISSVGTGPIVLYAVGLGPTDPPASSASGGASSEPLNRVEDDVSVFIGDTQATVLFAGLAPGFPGIYQLNVVPNGPVTDRVYLRVNGWQSNIASLSIPAGSNAINVTGSVQGAYPGNSVPVPYSTLLTAEKFNVDLVVAPDAKPFSVRRYVASDTEGADASGEVRRLQRLRMEHLGFLNLHAQRSLQPVSRQRHSTLRLNGASRRSDEFNPASRFTSCSSGWLLLFGGKTLGDRTFHVQHHLW